MPSPRSYVALPLALLAMLQGCATVASGTPASAPQAQGQPQAPVPAPVPAPTTSRAALRQFIDSLADAPEFRSAQWGLLVVDPERAETLYARNADKLFMPASNQKLITASTALTLLGPEHRWPTTLLARGPVRNGVLQGDLVVRGTGDPSVSASMFKDALIPLRALADSLRVKGVTRVRGRLVAAPSPFTDSPLGFGWAWDDLDEPYSAGVDALYFNEGFTEVVVYGGARAGEPVRAVTRPASTYPALIVRARTVSRAAAGASAADSIAAVPAIKVTQDSSRTGMLVSGTIAAGDSAVIGIAFRDHPAAYLAALREALRAQGILVDEARTDTTARVDSIVAMVSPPLREILPYFEKPSQNQIGELLFKTMALSKTGTGTADSAQQVVGRQLLAWGAAPDGFAVRDGSGLSRHDFVSPRTIVHVLDAMRRSPDFKLFYDALPIAGVDGTIKNRMKGTPAAGNVHAKTGTLDKVRSLSGYVTTADGRLLLFSALNNNYMVPTRRVDQATDALSIRLATLRLEPQ
jgi:D-alanyl-D-alanine carboxypeptidase/D-alanyl-D-alanine-endopeptidase (penicillin-binding protein 4)